MCIQVHNQRQACVFAFEYVVHTLNSNFLSNGLNLSIVGFLAHPQTFLKCACLLFSDLIVVSFFGFGCGCFVAMMTRLSRLFGHFGWMRSIIKRFINFVLILASLSTTTLIWMTMIYLGLYILQSV